MMTSCLCIGQNHNQIDIIHQSYSGLISFINTHLHLGVHLTLCNFTMCVESYDQQHSQYTQQFIRRTPCATFIARDNFPPLSPQSLATTNFFSISIVLINNII